MDEATAVQIAKNYGVPPTRANISNIMRESGNESALLGRSMGLKGGGSEEGYDDSILKSRLTKLSGEATPAANDKSSAIENPSKDTPKAIANVSKDTGPRMASPAPQVGQSAPSSNGLDINAVLSGSPIAASATPTSGYETPPDVSATMPAANNPSDWLMALLGLSAAGAKNNAAPPMTPNPQLTGPGNNPQLTYQPKLAGPDGQPTFPSGAPDNTVNQPQPQQRTASPQSIAPEGVIPPNTDANASRVRNEPVRPTFTPQEELTQALMNFRKMFRK